MNKQLTFNAQIDPDYERHVTGLGRVGGHVSDYPSAPQYPERRAQRQTLVLPEAAHSAYQITQPEGAMLASAGAIAGQLVNAPYQPVNSADARQMDSAITRDKASLMYSLAYAVPAALITAGLLWIVHIFQGGDLGAYFFAGLVIWGVALLVILFGNRGQGLHHSPSGIAHHEIEARIAEAEIRAGLAHYAIDAHIALLRHKWALEDQRNHGR